MTPKFLRLKRREEKKKAKAEHSAAKRREREDYKKRLRTLKTSHNIRLEEYYLKTGAPRPIDPPKRPVIEEVGNAITHGVGSIFAVVVYILMLIASDTPAEYAAASIYFAGMFIMFTMSCLYHSLPHGSAVKRLFRRFDYSCIYLLIGATFAPILLCFFADGFGYTFFVIQWLIIALGIAMVGVWGPTKLRYIHIPLYVVLGWSALMLLPRMIGGSLPMALYILAGGVIYTLGIIPYAMRSKVSHFVWHFFVLAGAVVQWIGVYFYLYLA